MKYHHIVLLAVVFFYNMNCFGQEETKFRRHEIGFNATLFIKQFVNFNNNTIPFSPYQLTYKYMTKNNINFRLGAGLSSSKVTQDMDTMEDKVTKNYAMNYRLGFEGQSIINKHWKCYYGLDVTYDYMDLSSVAGSTSMREITKGFGAGPVLGIQYYINDRVSLFTEMGLLYKKLDSKVDITSTSSPKQNQSTKSNELSTNIFIPTTLFVAIRI